MAAFLLLSLSYSNSLTAQDNDFRRPVFIQNLISYRERRLFFFDDFSSENIGDFPVLWNTTGSGEIVTHGKYPGKWLNTTNPQHYNPV